MNICARCIIPDDFPGAHFDSQGICHFCRQPAAAVDASGSSEDLAELLEQNRSDPYDCIVCYSGGKDSTYTLQTLVQDYGLKVLAFTFDHGFTSTGALSNIECVTRALNVDTEIYRPDPAVIRRIFKTSIRELPAMPPESIYGRGMQEYGPVCYVCGCMIHSIAIRLAMRTGARLIATGYTTSQDPDYYKGYATRARPVGSPSAMSAEPWLAIARIMHHFLRYADIKGLEDLFLTHLSADDVKEKAFLRMFDFIRYDERQIYRRIAELGWQKPTDTDSCSTNCLLNSLGIYIYHKTRGYHPYTKQLADLVRRGLLTRADALQAVQAELNMGLVRDIALKLGLDPAEF
ncbi:MAG: 7-cyano-7-deazaguanine synthase [Desulfobacterales bacterium]|nr:MAG: 7-cyano-7-deazaguanine synthase [Desulfobacterales bacterium]